MTRAPFPPGLHAAVLLRDRGCVLAFLEPGHACRDTWGNPHSPHDLARLQMEHVKAELRMGKRAPNDLGHVVALCAAANLRPPTKVQRDLFRQYLRAQELRA
ncbi:hypothetical protein UFOVP1028_9 [uncultured Caudovirales phage]|uniref:Uncharacterized protein n=1 Tax=uncultured Caudovirales phage TaxID=2100421 RepID=A0A6J5SM14_9CAUD|nr:hypothetical protein UFOVP960_20 [uncultured Caudovirales phage]CAB4178832.1 hypothetical protein UFOVP1028_9 [uncultured Caudovirales phage]CAB4189417.1 hypothetical protein UFOVP1187_10 [uncultured Caudovirales phage]CAB4192335.1 hypothetical protein UFOVP1235_27 [uncultured Caudovirales phage]CAB4215786.1 hypothetical protein UFOVP1488_10 [uncultured Caudovirales phage]